MWIETQFALEFHEGGRFRVGANGGRIAGVELIEVLIFLCFRGLHSGYCIFFWYEIVISIVMMVFVMKMMLMIVIIPN